MKHEWNLILAVCYQLKQLKKQPEKNSGLNGIRNPWPCDTGAMLYPLSYQATWMPTDCSLHVFKTDKETNYRNLKWRLDLSKGMPALN